MAIPPRFLRRFRKVGVLSQAHDDNDIASKRLEGEINKLRIYSQSLEAKLKDYEQLLELMSSELQSLRDGREHSLLPTITFSPDLQSGQMAGLFNALY